MTWSTEPPRGVEKEFRFVRLKPLWGGEEPAAIKFSKSGEVERVMLLGYDVSRCSLDMVAEWGPVIEGDGGSLSKAREAVLAGARTGVECPCCAQLVQIYKRSLNNPMCRALIWLVESFGVDSRWYAIGEFPIIQKRPGGGDFGKLAHWDFIKQKKNEDGTKHTSGMWKPTTHGIDFVYDRCTARSYVFLFQNEVEEWSTKYIGIQDALGESFDYSKLVKAQ